MRNRDDIAKVWQEFTAQCKAADLTLQLLLDRAMKEIIKNCVKCSNATPVNSQTQPLTSIERNAVRYMAGYIAVKLLKRYTRTYKNVKVHKLFVQQYTSLWMELIDRGGLYQINDDVLNLVVDIEMMVRCHLSLKNFNVFV